MSNLVPRQYREVSVASVDFPLSAGRLAEYFRGREVYKRTRYVVVRHGAETAIVSLETAPSAQVMTRAVGVTVLALPSSCVYVVASEADTGVPSSLASVALSSGALSPGALLPGAGIRAVVVEGRYHHVNFILDPAPLRLRVVDVVPPAPAKLVDQIERVLAVAEDLAPIEVVPEVIDLGDLARGHPAPRYLLPCRGSGFSSVGTEISFLDERPMRQEWTLIGCARSRELHRWFYGDLPPAVDMCPRSLASACCVEGAVTLTKCCLLEDRIDVTEGTVVVPWGASLKQIRSGLQAAVAVASGLQAAETLAPRATAGEVAPAPAPG